MTRNQTVTETPAALASTVTGTTYSIEAVVGTVRFAEASSAPSDTFEGHRLERGQTASFQKNASEDLYVWVETKGLTDSSAVIAYTEA